MSNICQLVDINPTPVVGISTTLTKSQNENAVIISTLWKRFNAQIHKIGNRPSSRSDWKKFGITYSSNHEYCYLAAIPFAEGMLAPSHMIRKHIARGRYACFTHTGKLSNLSSTVYAIHREILPGENLTPESSEKAGLIQFERYDHRFHWNRSDSIIEIYVPVMIMGRRA